MIKSVQEFKCSNGRKASTYYQCENGFDIKFNKKGEPLFKCRYCGTVYDIHSINKKKKEYGFD